MEDRPLLLPKLANSGPRFSAPPFFGEIARQLFTRPERKDTPYGATGPFDASLLAIIGAIINVATQQPALRLVGVALALLSVPARDIKNPKITDRPTLPFTSEDDDSHIGGLQALW